MFTEIRLCIICINLYYLYHWMFCVLLLLYCIVILLWLFALMELVLFNLLLAVKLKYYLTITIVDDVKWNTWHYIVVLVTLYML